MIKIKVLVVDDHKKVRQTIRNMISRSPKMEVVGEAKNGYEAIALTKSLEPDVMVLDVEMPGIKGYEVARRVTNNGSSVRVLALSGYDDKALILGMFLSGAVGYLTKEEAPQQLLQAVNDVAAGHKGWISPKTAKKLGVPAQPLGRNTIPALTELETQILDCLKQEKSDLEIKNALNIELEIVKDCIQSITQKLGAQTRFEAIFRALQEGLI